MNLKVIGKWFIGIILVIIGIVVLPPTFLALLTIFGLIGFFLFRSWKKRKTMSQEGKNFSKKMLTATGVGLLFVAGIVLFVNFAPKDFASNSDTKSTEQIQPKSEVTTSAKSDTTKTSSTPIQKQTKTLSEEKIADISEDCYDSATNQLVACYSGLAIKYNNPNFCGQITKSYQWTRDPALTARYKVGDEWVNFAIIDYIFVCYARYKEATKDTLVISVCQNYEGKYLSKECNSRLS